MTHENFKTAEFARATRQASIELARLSTEWKNRALFKMAEYLLKDEDKIIAENAKDLKQAEKNGLSPAMIDRLVLNHERLEKMAHAVQEIAALPDPVGKVNSVWKRPNGIEVSLVHIPLGVVMMIYESRPNVTSDAAALCLKSGNAVILRGGSEAFHSNQAIGAALHKALQEEKIPSEAISVVPTTDRKIMEELLTQDELIDLIIPRGGEGLIRFVAKNSRIPVIKHYKGVCHMYVDADADEEVAMNLLIDGKLSRPGVCNALETMLVHQDVAETFLPQAGEYLREKGVELRGCERTRKIVPYANDATEEDYEAEFLSLILTVKVVSDLDEAVSHIHRYGSDHTEVIVTNNLANTQRFIKEINSSVVMVNASSRFSDGGELGLGAEIGISTTKLHAYGPMGLEALTTKKFVIMGSGQTRHNLHLNQ
ncbi:glutamate-5-semialdehyde dehydrogenase [candidate division KSB1 bacterium]|nr:glutamate-5-semialdehyde dehydrogenase [candidate division KSB1 bacterium]